MNTGGLLEAVKTVGALVGLITGIFVVVDRLMRNRPYISYRPRNATQSSLDLLVHNASEDGIAIEGVEISPHVFSLAYGQALIDTVRAAATPHHTDERVAFVPAQSTVALPLIEFNNWEDAADDVIVTLELRWRSCSSRWLWTWPLKIKRTVGELKKLKQASQPQKI